MKFVKYRYNNEHIPQESRQELNDKILYLIDQGLADQSGISREDIYNAYTGDGGLHGLRRSDFANYHEFAEAKKEIENGQFFTPPPLCQFIMEALSPAMDETVADLTSGISNFCNFMPVESNFYGCELDIKSHKVAHYLYPAANLEHRDIRFYQPDIRFDYVVGNPPFNLKWQTEDGGGIISQMYYCIKAAELLKPLGIMAIVVPASFLSDEYLDSAKISELKKDFSFLGQVSIQKDAFKALGVDNYATKILLSKKNLDVEEEGKQYALNSANWFNLTDMDNAADLLEIVQTEIVAPAREKMRSNSARIKLSSLGKNSSEFEYEVRKMMYHIKSNPKLIEKYSKCQEYLYKFHHQVQPSDMKYEDWVRVRITEAKVLAYLRRVIRSQNSKPSRDVVCLVKQDGGLIYKGYSKKVRDALPNTMKQLVPFYSLVSGQSEMDTGNYARLIRRKQRDYQRETKPFKDMEQDPEIARYLDEFSVYDSENEEWIHLNDIQKHDLNLVLQKHYHLLQWEQGSGKTLAGIVVGQYRMEQQHARNVWVVSTAISIKNNWDLVLKNFRIGYRMIKKLSDLEAVQDGEFVIITLGMLSKYRKKIKRHIKMRNQNICLVFDESDEMTNPDSKRTKAVLDCFRRVRFKFAMTGTVTRNNISESAPQLELLYNNSYNMLSWSEQIYCYNKEGEDEYLDCLPNPYYGEPIPAYKAGYKLFSECHLPERITVFGVGKKNQDIYNADVLDKLLSYAVITRTLPEITGREIRKIHQVPVVFSSAEREVYNKAMEEFHSMRQRYFALSGNSRKDSMMALIQQITLLLRISAAPNTVDEYNSPYTPTKILKVCNMVEEFGDEIVVIGVRHKIVVDAYADELRRRFPKRKLFVVTGSTTTLAKRRKLKSALKESGNGILLCTQQCLPSSVNFEFINKVIIPELHYNNARMSQFYMRFVRFNSKEDKDIYFVTYSGSIESNQMQMVIAKERLNLFMKGQDVDLDEIYERFGVDYDLMGMLMSKEYDEDGRFRIAWGEQKIS